MSYVHLHCHTHYSLLDGANRIKPLVAKAKELKMPALAITDHGNLYGAIEFYSACKDAGIKPIIGYEAYIAPGSRFTRDSGGISEAAYHLTLLAKNHAGYKNLIKLASLAFTEGFYYRPRIDKEALLAHKEGLIVLSGCASSEFCQLIQGGKLEEATEIAEWYAKHFGEDYYMEIMNNGYQGQLECFDYIRATGQGLGLPVVATSDTHYLCKEDAAAHDVLLCINTGARKFDTERMRYEPQEYYLRTPAEMQNLFDPAEVDESVRISEKCNLEIDFKTRHFPPYIPPRELTNEQYLRELCETGIVQRLGDSVPKTYRDRLEHELAIINKMGFAGYFLVVADFVQFARDNSIPVSARGSAAGSLVSYVLGLSNVDPIRFGLLFERFLDPSRSEPPDIDIDFCSEKRELVLQYVREKYGADRVAPIITFSTLAARAAIRDVGRVLEVDIPTVNRVIKLVPDEFRVTIQDAIDKSSELRDLMASNDQVRDLIQTAQKLEGTNRNVGTHAAGIVITDKPLTEYIPLAVNDGQVTTQWTMGDLEKIGLLKMDFLGLRNLTVLAKTLKLIGKPIDIDRLPLDDPEVYAMISRGETQGIFQLDTDSARAIVTKMKPDQFNDIIAVAALNRPATLSEGMVDQYIAVKHGEKQIEYAHPGMAQYLDYTYGVMVYQEQVMQVLHVIGGIDLTQAYTCIKAISKKFPDKVAKFYGQFVDGAVARGLTVEKAREIFGLIQAFAGYGFNKSHSCAYAMIAYQTAWLKVHYPAEFMAALLDTEIDVADKLAEHLEDCRRMGIQVIPPDINHPETEFSVLDGKIVCPLTIVRSVSANGAAAIKAGAPYEGLFDFCERIHGGAVNAKGVECLIKAGAFDSLHPNRAKYLDILPQAIREGERTRKTRSRGQKVMVPMGGGDPESNVQEWPLLEKLAHEKFALGFYLSGNPFSVYDLGQYCTHSIKELKDVPGGTEVVVGGMIGGVKYNSTRFATKRNNMRMAKFSFEDKTGSVPCVMFPDDLYDQSEIVVDDHICYLIGKVDHTYEDTGLCVTRVVPIKQAARHFSRAIVVKLPKSSCFSGDIKQRVAAAQEKHPGLDVRLEAEAYDGSRLLLWSRL